MVGYLATAWLHVIQVTFLTLLLFPHFLFNKNVVVR